MNVFKRAYQWSKGIVVRPEFATVYNPSFNHEQVKQALADKTRFGETAEKRNKRIKNRKARKARRKQRQHIARK